MENKTESTHTNTIGILEMISAGMFGLVAIICFLVAMLEYTELGGPAGPEQAITLWWACLISFLVSVLVASAGVAAFKKKLWYFVLFGSFISIPTILGIPAFILIIKYEDEFIS